jgi:hypothetical protein
MAMINVWKLSHFQKTSDVVVRHFGLLGFLTLPIVWYSNEGNVAESGPVSIFR